MPPKVYATLGERNDMKKKSRTTLEHNQDRHHADQRKSDEKFLTPVTDMQQINNARIKIIPAINTRRI